MVSNHGNPKIITANIKVQTLNFDLVHIIMNLNLLGIRGISCINAEQLFVPSSLFQLIPRRLITPSSLLFPFPVPKIVMPLRPPPSSPWSTGQARPLEGEVDRSCDPPLDPPARWSPHNSHAHLLQHDGLHPFSKA